MAGGARIGRHAQHQHAFAAGASAPAQVTLHGADQARVAGQRQIGFGLDAVGQAQHRQREPALHQFAHGGLGGIPTGQKNGMEAFVFGQRRHAQRGLGQHAEAPLGTEHQFAQVRAGAGGRKGRQGQTANGRLQPPACEQLLDAAVAQRLLAAGTRHHPATHGGVFERLRKMPQRKSARAQLRLDQRPRGARAEGGELAGRVEVQQAVHAGQVERQDRAFADRAVQVPRHAGAAGERDHDPVVLVRQVEQHAHLLARLGKRDPVRHRRQGAKTLAQPVGKTLAHGDRESRRRGGVDQRMATQARGGNRGQHPGPRDVGAWQAGAQARRDHGARAVAQGHRGGIVAPAVPSSHALLH